MAVRRVRCIKKAGIAENAAHFLRRNGETLGHSGDLFVFAQPHFWDYYLSKFFRYLQKRLSTHHPLTPSTNCVVDARRLHNMRLQCSQVVKEMIVLASSDQVCSFACATLSEFPLLKEVVRSGHASRDECSPKQPSILSMLC